MTDQELDDLVGGLPAFEPPADVQRRVLEAASVSSARIELLLGPALSPQAFGPGSRRSFGDERGGSPLPVAGGGRQALPPRSKAPTARLWAAFGLAAALAASAALAVRSGTDRVADPSQLVARGAGEVTQSLSLRVAVRRGATTERLAVGSAYSAGDTLIFRVSSSVAGPIVLRRDDEILYRGSIPAGDSDLPVGYTLEAGQGAARFVVEGGDVRDLVEIPRVAP